MWIILLGDAYQESVQRHFLSQTGSAPVCLTGATSAQVLRLSCASVGSEQVCLARRETRDIRGQRTGRRCWQELHQDGDGEESVQACGFCEDPGVREGLLQEERAADALGVRRPHRLCPGVHTEDIQPVHTGMDRKTNAQPDN